ncbi:heparan-alpha-glucosaminide N-acetyltransferase domain-containing protein [Gemmatimonas sp.]|uniref:acyltransferase family protein n=1 Tax=Gemmatimonas sp. TaxID=1962908 RepID=UPI00286B5D6A|nr:heparan-alpha-glucosaminide N-acetyltransferase domain-containing protein [Gemmatimonas sp.]
MAADRVVAIDVFRGITVVAMLLVNNAGDPMAVFSPLRHSAWNGCTFTDLVFPFFLFVVGITTHLTSMPRVTTQGVTTRDANPGRTTRRRVVLLFGIGLLLNAWPFFEKSRVAGPDWLSPVLGHIVARAADLRVMGVLQRIAVTYGLAALLSRRASSRTVLLIIVGILLSYWAALTLVPVPGEGAIGAQLLDEPGRTLSAWVDRAAFDWTRFGLGWHLWDRAVPYEPEGVLSTLSATATVLIGVLVGRWLTSTRPLSARARGLAGVSVGLIVVGLVWGVVLPINKPLWTGSYVLLTAGIAGVLLAGITALVHGREQARWLRPALTFGLNPMIAYVGSELVATILRSSIKWKLDGHRIGTGMAVTRVLESVGVDSRVASLFWALAFVALWYAILRALRTRGVAFRVT